MLSNENNSPLGDIDWCSKANFLPQNVICLDLRLYLATVKGRGFGIVSA